MKYILALVTFCSGGAAALEVTPAAGTTNASNLTSGTLPNERLNSSSVTLKGNWSLEMPGPIQAASISATSATLTNAGVSSNTTTGTLNISNSATVGFLITSSSITLSSHTNSGTLSTTGNANIGFTLSASSVSISSTGAFGTVSVSSSVDVAKSLRVTENVTASKFIGDGSLLTGVTGSFNTGFSSATRKGWGGTTTSSVWVCLANSSMTITVGANGKLHCSVNGSFGIGAGNVWYLTFMSVKSGDAFAVSWDNNNSAGGTGGQTAGNINQESVAISRLSPFIPTAADYTVCPALRVSGNTLNTLQDAAVNPEFTCSTEKSQ